jgi:hypothetical protein
VGNIKKARKQRRKVLMPRVGRGGYFRTAKTHQNGSNRTDAVTTIG